MIELELWEFVSALACMFVAGWLFHYVWIMWRLGKK